MAHIPGNGADEAAVYCCDMLSTGFMAAENANIPVGGTVAVFALGPVGLMAVAAARLCGAGLVIGVESMPKRQELGRFYGADVIVDHTKSDPVKEILKLPANQSLDTASAAFVGDGT